MERNHHPHDGRQGEEIAEDGDHAGGEHFVEGVHVRGEPGHQPAHRVAVEEAGVQPLQVLEDLHAQVEHHLQPGQLHAVGLQEIDGEGGQQGEQVQRRNLRQPCGRVGAQPGIEEGGLARRGRQVAVDGHLGQEGADRLQPGVQQDGQEAERHQRLVRAQVGQQPLHQPRVVRLPQDFFLVVLLHNQAAGCRLQAVASGLVGSSSLQPPVSSLLRPAPVPLRATASRTARCNSRRARAVPHASPARRFRRGPAPRCNRPSGPSRPGARSGLKFFRA